MENGCGKNGQLLSGHWDISKFSVCIYSIIYISIIIYICGCLFLKRNADICIYMLYLYIFIELCGLPMLMHIEGFVAKLCILYIYIVKSFVMSNP